MRRLGDYLFRVVSKYTSWSPEFSVFQCSMLTKYLSLGVFYIQISLIWLLSDFTLVWDDFYSLLHWFFLNVIILTLREAALDSTL